MRISSIRIENFRGYLDTTSLSVGAWTSIVGRNDVGKSTLLDARAPTRGHRKVCTQNDGKDEKRLSRISAPIL